MFLKEEINVTNVDVYLPVMLISEHLLDGNMSHCNVIIIINMDLCTWEAVVRNLEVAAAAEQRLRLPVHAWGIQIALEPDLGH